MKGIVILAERLAVGDASPRQRRIAEVIAESGSSLMTMINEISDPSGIEAGELRLGSVPVDLCDVVEGVCSLFWDWAMLKGIDLSAYVDPATPRLSFGDPTRLRQVIGALVNNAIRSTKTGGVLVEVEPDSAGSLRISVRDTGVGITREEIAGVFDGFTQTDQRHGREPGGGSRGLTISESLYAPWTDACG